MPSSASISFKIFVENVYPDSEFSIILGIFETKSAKNFATLTTWLT